MSTSCKTVLKWKQQNSADDKSMLFHLKVHLSNKPLRGPVLTQIYIST